MVKFEVAATGKLISGHIFDVNKHSFLIAAQNYDPQLYLWWNPRKRRGLGCWELRRRPDKKTAVYQGTLAGVDYYSLETVENPMISHVMDIPFLSYKYIERLHEIDAWEVKNWVDRLEDEEDAHYNTELKRAKESLSYSIKQDKRVFRQFKDMVQSGVNPALIAQYWGSKP